MKESIRRGRRSATSGRKSARSARAAEKAARRDTSWPGSAALAARGCVPCSPPAGRAAFSASFRRVSSAIVEAGSPPLHGYGPSRYAAQAVFSPQSAERQSDGRACARFHARAGTVRRRRAGESRGDTARNPRRVLAGARGAGWLDPGRWSVGAARPRWRWGASCHRGGTSVERPRGGSAARLAVVNPGSAAFWAGVGATLLATRLPGRGRESLLLFALGYYAALLLWSVAFASVVGQARRWLPPRYLRLMQRGLALLLGALALFALGRFWHHGLVVPAE